MSEVLRRIGKANAVATCQFTVLETVRYIQLVIFRLALHIRLLDTASGRRIIMSNGQADHGTVREHIGFLNEAFAERAAAQDQPAIPVLDSAGNDLTGGG